MTTTQKWFLLFDTRLSETKDKLTMLPVWYVQDRMLDILDFHNKNSVCISLLPTKVIVDTRNKQSE